MSKDMVKIGLAVVCLLVAGVVVAWQFGVFGGGGTQTAASGTQAGTAGGQATGTGTQQEGEGITITNPGGFIPPQPRDR